MQTDPAQVYQPEADTYLLLSAAMHEVRPTDRVIEIGTGSGLIASQLALRAQVVATDISPHAVMAARGWGAEVVRADLFFGLRGPFDLIVFNPPYLPTLPEERMDDWLEYALDGGESGRTVIDRFLVEADSALCPQGRILLLVSSLTGLSEVLGTAAACGYRAKVVADQAVEDEILYVLRLERPEGRPGVMQRIE